MPPKVPQVKPSKSKYNKDPYGQPDHGKNTVDLQKPGQRPSLGDFNSNYNNKDVVQPHLPHGLHTDHDDIGHQFGDDDEEVDEVAEHDNNNTGNNNSNEADYPIRRPPPPNYPGPGFFNPSTSKNQFQDLNYQQPRPNVYGGGNGPQVQVVDKNLPPNELYQILTGQAVPGGANGQQLTFEQILQHIQAIDGQSVGQPGHPLPGQQQQQRPTNQQSHPHLPPFLTGHLNQNNVNYPPTQFGARPDKLPPGW